MNAEQQGDGGHDEQGQHAVLQGFGLQEQAAKVDHRQQAHQVEPMATGQQQGAAADAARQFAKCRHRTRKRHRTNKDADVNFHGMNGMGCAVQVLGSFGIYVGGITHQHCSHTDHAVHQGNQFGHLRHLHFARSIKADDGANEHGTNDHGDAFGRHLWAEHGGQNG